MKNNFSPELRRKIISGYIKKKMNEKYTWTMLMREFGYATGKKPLNNPLEFFNNAVEVAKNIPSDFWEATTDGTVASKVAGDGVSLLIESASKKASLIVDSALFISQSVNIYARSTASESAYKKPYPIVVAYAKPNKAQTIPLAEQKHQLGFIKNNGFIALGESNCGYRIAGTKRDAGILLLDAFLSKVALINIDSQDIVLKVTNVQYETIKGKRHPKIVEYGSELYQVKLTNLKYTPLFQKKGNTLSKITKTLEINSVNGWNKKIQVECIADKEEIVRPYE